MLDAGEIFESKERKIQKAMEKLFVKKGYLYLGVLTNIPIIWNPRLNQNSSKDLRFKPEELRPQKR